jgi:hypothetical protein
MVRYRFGFRYSRGGRDGRSLRSSEGDVHRRSRIGGEDRGMHVVVLAMSSLRIMFAKHVCFVSREPPPLDRMRVGWSHARTEQTTWSTQRG